MGLWDLEAKWYDGWRRTPAVRWILEQEKRNLRFLINSITDFPLSVVDVGTGAGSTLDIFPGTVRLIGMDRSFSMITLAGKGRSLAGIAGDISRPPFRKGSIRFLSVIGVLEYVSDYHAFLREAEIILSENGYLLVTISPSGFLNTLRSVLGHPLYPIRTEEWEMSMKTLPFVRLQSRRSLLQMQFLYRKETSMNRAP
jgi:ubiquinone/menaquinone biosynthesis C-methylase UbiE